MMGAPVGSWSQDLDDYGVLVSSVGRGVVTYIRPGPSSDNCCVSPTLCPK